MSERVIIKVDNISKIFRLPRERNSSIKSIVVNFYRRKKGYDLQKALNQISLDIHEGEFFGIVGRNGSGKSTLLKLLAGIYTPTTGAVHIGGTLTPFIELGVGFNPELTGRENVYLNGALLGFNRKEMQAMYKDIVEFAELEKFMDQKLKNYSSGMQVRLAFSIAIRAKSDILLIDEVLAVGDGAFQRKCFEHFDQLKREKKTVVLVTHDMSAVEKYCDRAILIDKGNPLMEGEPRRIAAEYKLLNLSTYQEGQPADHNAAVDIKSVKINGRKELVIEDDQELDVSVNFVPRETQELTAAISIYRDDNVQVAYFDNSQLPNPLKGHAKKAATIHCIFPSKQFLHGAYKLEVEFLGKQVPGLSRALDAVRFVIAIEHPSKAGVINLDANWKN